MLEEVRFVPSLKSNLISLVNFKIRDMCLKGNERIHGSDERCKEE